MVDRLVTVKWKDSLGNTWVGGPMPESEYSKFVARVEFSGGKIDHKSKKYYD